jgi:ubiquinone/menaquinone biosynthesis C-methylase UbiE
MTDHFEKIYSRQADAYHRFIAVEDVDGNLIKAIDAVISLDGKRVVDLGTGTGRLPLLFAHRTAAMIGLDLQWDMLRRHRQERAAIHGQWSLAQSDMRAVPIRSGWAQVVTAAWSISNLRGIYQQDWQTQIGFVLNEMQRLCEPGGTLIIFETLTTGSLTPAPPSDALAEYYAWLETQHGFTRTTLSTDYQFESVDQAIDYTEFFFGPELSQKIRANHWSRLPEWTGLWVKHL